MTSERALFISHTAADRPYAVALEQALHELLGSEDVIDVHYSTSAETGPQGGDQWRNWIDEQVVAARTALVLVTPEAIGKPWLLWEAGAYRGASLAKERAKVPEARLLVCVAYGISETEWPDPLRGDQIVSGLDRDRMEQLLIKVLDNHDLLESHGVRVGKRMQDVLERYLEAAQEALLSSPSLVTEANIQDWLARLEEMADEDRGSELAGFERWMSLAFGREGETAQVPIDVRLHRRLGELYLEQEQFERAVVQLKLARRAAPRDIYVLRPLGEAHVKRYLERDGGDQGGDDLRREIRDVLAAIEDLDEGAFVTNPDAAGLYGKFHRRALKDADAAIGIFQTSLERNPDSYYLADVLAQTQLEDGRVEDGRRTYKRAIEILGRLGEVNVWTHSTYATAHLAQGDLGAVRASLEEFKREDPPDSVVSSLASAMREVGARVGVADTDVEALLAALPRGAMSEES